MQRPTARRERVHTLTHTLMLAFSLAAFASLAVVPIAMAEPAPPLPAPASPQPAAPSGTPSTPTPAPATPTPAPRPAGKRAPQITLHGWTETRATASPEDDADRVTLGRLAFARVDVHCDDTKVGETLRAFCDAVGVNMALKFDVGFVDDTPVYLDLDGVVGVTALEAIISLGGSDATWQLRRGILEIGSRSFLSRGNARRTQLYDVSTLVVDVPYTPSGSMAPPPISSPGGGTTFQPQFTLNPDPDVYRRKAPAELAADLMQAIVNQVEQEAWQPLPEGDGSEGTKGPPPKLPGGASGKNQGQRNQSTNADRNFDAALGPVFVRGKWANMNYYQQGAQLVVSAPDFVHRGIGGYPKPLPVAAASR